SEPDAPRSLRTRPDQGDGLDEVGVSLDPGSVGAGDGRSVARQSGRDCNAASAAHASLSSLPQFGGSRNTVRYAASISAWLSHAAIARSGCSSTSATASSQADAT